MAKIVYKDEYLVEWTDENDEHHIGEKLPDEYIDLVGDDGEEEK